ncbi:hypothetical protein M8C13_30775 [Crossiella sp. SN42]|uniref:hypothetical protein n=1 Tax=Crossiella sp. SN42 TaxID=2944808 RepID=UPI00207CA568|nr:hypothetical protein [Crossiella sp. SN42]MCO1580148.1 hypothetical protein [Crossiella sp. SN42]
MRTTLLAAAASALTLTTLAACSGGSPAAQSPAPTSSSAPAAATKLASPAELATAVNAAMLAKKTVQLSADVVDSRKPAESVKTKSQLRFEDGGRVSSAMVAEQPEGATRTVMLPAESFLSSPDQEQETPGKPWRRFTVGGEDLTSKLMTSLMNRYVEMSDPSRGIVHFAAAGQLDSSAAEPVDGAAATRYTITVDYAKAAAASTDKLVKTNLESKVKLNRNAMKHEIWLDANNLPLRWRATETGKVEFTTTLDAKFQDWGKPVEIAAPPATQVGESS